MTVNIHNIPSLKRRPLELERLVGNTPLLALRQITAHLPETVRIHAKAEWFNPGGSVKDRAALNILRAGEASGQLAPGKTILESTSGNTGIALAMFGAALGYPVELCIPENASPERLQILRAYGAKLVMTPAEDGSDGAQLAARARYEADPARYFYAAQYDNPANWQAHFYGTGSEIWVQTHGQITHFVAALGTSGTFTGVTRRLKLANPAIQAIALQPDAPFHGLEGMKHLPTAIRPGFYDESLVDRIMGIATEEAYAMVMRLAREEGLLVGLSSGAAAAGALRLAEELAAAGRTATIVTVFPDNGFKYLSRAPFTT
ncbi:MAG: cysteine synthase B [Anaerolineae bacterium]